MRTAAVVVVALVLGVALGLGAAALLSREPVRDPNPAGAPVVCSERGGDCRQGDERVRNPQSLKRPCLPNSNAFWTSVGGELLGGRLQPTIGSQRGLVDTFVCVGAV